MGYVVSGLTTYVETNKDVLVKDIVLGAVYGDTIQNLAKQFGVKTTERLNYLNVDPVLQSGSGCGFSAVNSTELNERDITTAIYRVNETWCPDDLLSKFAEYLVRFGADANAENMPYERLILDEIVKGINKKMEQQVWLGDTANTGRTDLINGFITQALGADSAATINVTGITSSTTVYDAIKAVVMAIPEEIIDDATVFVSPAIYRAFVQALVEKNWYHFPVGGDEQIEDKDIKFPGSEVRVHKTIGLTGDKRHIYASTYKNMVYACDMMNDKEEARLWFSDDDDLFKLKIKWNAGVKTYFPDMVVLGTAAADLV